MQMLTYETDNNKKYISSEDLIVFETSVSKRAAYLSCMAGVIRPKGEGMSP